MTYKMSIVVPSHQDSGLVFNLLSSLKKQVVSFNFEVLVICNPPSLALEKKLAGYENVRVLHQNRIGVNAARNRGIKEAQSEILLFFDADCEISDPSLVEKHYQSYLKDKSLKFLGGLYENRSEKILDQTYQLIQTRWLLNGVMPNYAKYLLGGHFSCRKDCIEQFLFDDQIVYGGSETELFVRLVSNGILPQLRTDLVIEHRTHLTLFTLVKKLYRQGMGRRYIEDKLMTSLDERDISKKSLEYSVLKYKKGMDFYLYISDFSFRKGYSQNKNIGAFKLYLICARGWFSYQGYRASEAFLGLENILRSLSK